MLSWSISLCLSTSFVAIIVRKPSNCWPFRVTTSWPRFVLPASLREISRVLSKINVGSSSREGMSFPKVSERTCSSGNCTTIDIPGPSK